MKSRPGLYKPVFGNDNFYAPDVIDITSFNALDALALKKPEPKFKPARTK